MQQVTKDMIDCWRANYGLDKRSPEDAARWWDDECGMAPAGAVAALGLALRELEARTSRDADWYMAVVWPLLPVPGEFDGMKLKAVTYKHAIWKFMIVGVKTFTIDRAHLVFHGMALTLLKVFTYIK